MAAFDHFTRYWLNWLTVGLFVLAAAITRKPPVIALGVSLIGTAVTYLVLVTAMIFVVPAYVLPVSNLCAASASLCVLLERWRRHGLQPQEATPGESPRSESRLLNRCN